MNDANWLPSTIVQASAAFVAITGGFLITRFIAISSEIHLFRSKISELKLTRSPLADEFLRTHTERIRMDCEAFYKYWVGRPEMVNSDVDPSLIVAQYPLLCGDREDLREVSQNIVLEYRKAKLTLQNNLLPSELPSDSEEWLKRKPFELNDFSLPIIQHVARNEHDRRNIHLGFPNISHPNHGFEIFNAEVANRRDRQARIIRREHELEQELIAVDSQITLSQQEIANRVNPNHFSFLIVLLSYMSLVGILLPASAMAIDPVPATSLFKFTLIGLLSVGIFAFCFYLAIVVRSYVRDGKSSS